MSNLNFAYATNGIKKYCDWSFTMYLMDDFGNAVKINNSLVSYFECFDLQFEQLI